MYVQRFTRIFILVMLVLLALVPARAVSAESPVVYSGALDLYFPMDPQLCTGVEVWDHEVLTFRETDLFDNQGNLKTIKVLYLGEDNFYNPSNPNVVLSGKFAGTIYYDPQTGAPLKGVGLPYHITVPGYGAVLLRAGLWSPWPVSHLAGKDSFTDPKDVAAFCSFLR